LKLDKEVYTNFRSLSTEKVPGNLNFKFVDKNQIEELLFSQTCENLFLLKIELLPKSLITLINKKSTLINFDTLFNDGTYILINKKSS